MIPRIPLLIAAAAAAAFAQSGGVVSGRVISALHGEPVGGATVTLRGLDDGPAQTYIAPTDAAGRFSFPNIVPGTYEPRPSKAGFEQRLADRFATAHDFPPIVVEAGKAATPLELRLIPDGVIAGKVIDSDGDPVRRASVLALQYGYAGGKKQLRITHGAGTDDRGQYRLFHLAPGKYFVRVDPQNPRTVAQPQPLAGRVQWQNIPPQTGLAPAYYPSSPDEFHATELQVAPGMEIDGVDMRVMDRHLYSIRGHVPEDLVKQGISIFAMSMDTEDRQRSSGQRFDGDQYELFGLAPGKFTVTAQVFTNRQQKTSVPLYANQTVEVVDRDVDHVDLTFSPGSIIHGVIKTEGTLTPKDVMNVSLVPAEDAEIMLGGGARVDPDGTFKIETAPGVYRMRVAGRQAYIKSILIGKEPVPDRKIDTAHVNGDLTVIASNEFGKLQGAVVDENGKPVFNAEVSLIPDQRQPDWQERSRSALTKADGKFTMANVEPGEYRVYAWLGVEPGAPQDAEFRKPFEDRGVAVKLEANGNFTVELKVIQPSR